MKNKNKLKLIKLIIEDENYYETLKISIVAAIKEEWDKSKMGIYIEKSRPNWIKDILSDDYHPIDRIAKQAADNFLQKLFKN